MISGTAAVTPWGGNLSIFMEPSYYEMALSNVSQAACASIVLALNTPSSSSLKLICINGETTGVAWTGANMRCRNPTTGLIDVNDANIYETICQNTNDTQLLLLKFGPMYLGLRQGDGPHK